MHACSVEIWFGFLINMQISESLNNSDGSLNGRIAVRFIANCGLFIDCRGVRFMLDCPFGENRYFSPLPEKIIDACRGEKNSYADADYLLFTHRHEDHFDALKADDYAANNGVKGVFAPCPVESASRLEEDKRPLTKAAEKGILNEIELGKGESRAFGLSRDIKITFLRCAHLKGRYCEEAAHMAVVMDLAGKRLLALGDADASAENAGIIKDCNAPDIVFLTPLFLLQKESTEIIEALGARNVIMYHIPFEGYDRAGIRAMAAKRLKHSYPFRLTAFSEPGQYIRI